MAVNQSLTLTQVSQNAAANTSQVRVLWKSTQTGESWNGYTRTAYYYISVNGRSKTEHSVSYTLPKNTTQTIIDITVTVEHDGSGNCYVDVETWMDTDISAGVVTMEERLELPPIARESTIEATPANIGAASMIAVDRKNDAYTHSIAWRFGSLSGYIADASGRLSVSEVKLSATRISFPVPETFYGQIPDAPSGVCTLTIRTYSGNTQVGQAKTGTFKVTAEREACKPKVSGTVVDINETTKAVTGDESKLVRYMSTAQCTVTAEARNSAHITEKTVNGLTIADVLTIDNVGVGSFTFRAIDSREYSNTDDVSLELIPYERLTNNASVRRTDPTSGNAELTLRGTCFKGSFGAIENTLTVKYQIDSGETVELPLQINEDNSYYAVINLSGLEYTQTYSITVTVMDALDSVPTSKPLKVQKGIPVFDWGENDFSFHVPVTAPSFNGTVSEHFRYRGNCTDADKACLSGIYRLSDDTINAPNTNGLMLVFNCSDNSAAGLSPVLQIAMDFSGNNRKLRMIWYSNAYSWQDIS